ncbi:hypothetical protein [Mycolicibacterium wolinskyi]|uniref:hypothetical protein n=1 Tax=Mycolicibacterium wolinskyi TaxID=59750 RepID=UPI003BA96E15
MSNQGDPSNSSNEVVQRRNAGLCTSCRCHAVGDRVCRRGENGAGLAPQEALISDSGKVNRRPVLLDPPNQVAGALAHFAMFIDIEVGQV